jgi:hypothetical protein
LLLFPEATVFGYTSADRQRTAVRSLQLAMLMKMFEVLADRDQRGVQPLRQATDQNAAILVKDLQDCSTAFLTQHPRSPGVE